MFDMVQRQSRSTYMITKEMKAQRKADKRAALKAVLKLARNAITAMQEAAAANEDPVSKEAQLRAITEAKIAVVRSTPKAKSTGIVAQLFGQSPSIGDKVDIIAWCQDPNKNKGMMMGTGDIIKKCKSAGKKGTIIVADDESEFTMVYMGIDKKVQEAAAAKARAKRAAKKEAAAKAAKAAAK
jgi:hypothetical protein